MTRTSTRIVPLPAALIYDRDVTAVAVRMWAVYADWANDGGTPLLPGGTTSITIQQVADTIGVDIATIRRGNELLVSAGWITRDVRANHALTTAHTVKRQP